jgi:hypothetical protein
MELSAWEEYKKQQELPNWYNNANILCKYRMTFSLSQHLILLVI